MMEQRSDEWYSLRRKMIGASDAAPILGLTPKEWKKSNAYEVWLSKQEGYISEDNEAMKNGRYLEPIALDLFQRETGYLMVPKVLICKKNPFMMASLDGFELDESCAVEIKCPRGNSHAMAIAGEIPIYYIAQMQHQMAVTGLNQMYYCSYQPSHVKPLYITVVNRDDYFIKDMIEKESSFYHNHMVTGIAPENPVKTIDSDAWNCLSEEYIRLDQMEKNFSKRKEEIKDCLIQMSNCQTAKGNRIILQKIERKGLIDYQNIPHLKQLDLEQYRKPSTISWRITEINHGSTSSI